MSASPVFSSAAAGRPFIFGPAPAVSKLETALGKKAVTAAQILSRAGSTGRLAAVVPASRLEIRPAPEMVSSGIAQLDALTGGLPRGCLTEICGAGSCGKTSVLISALSQATRRGEVCALVDASDAFDPLSAAAAGLETERLLWVRCRAKNLPRRHGDTEKSLGKQTENNDQSVGVTGKAGKVPSVPLWLCGEKESRSEFQLEQVLKVTDLLLQSGGFGMIVLDLGDVPARSARRIPLASWFRFRRAVEHTPTALLVFEQQPIAGSCSSVLLKVSGKRPSSARMVAQEMARSGASHIELLDQLEITAELLRSRLEPKQPHPAIFKSRAKWAV